MATCNTKVYMHLQRSLALHQQNLVLYVCMSLIYIASYSACLLFIYAPTILIIDDLIDRKHYHISFYLIPQPRGVYCGGQPRIGTRKNNKRYYIQVKSIVLLRCNHDGGKRILSTEAVGRGDTSVLGSGSSC